MIEPTEQEIQRSILDYIALKRGVAVKVNNGGIRKPDGSYIPSRQRGISDIMACIKGRFYAIEVKRPGQKPTQDQIQFIREVILAGGEGFVAHSIEDLQSHGIK